MSILSEEDRYNHHQQFGVSTNDSDWIRFIRQCVLDGGHLLHVVHWSTAVTYKQVCDAYVNYTVQHYGGQSVVVCGGYDRYSSTKAAEQQGRATQSISADIMFECDMKTITTQIYFLANSKNTARLIDK